MKLYFCMIILMGGVSFDAMGAVYRWVEYDYSCSLSGDERTLELPAYSLSKPVHYQTKVVLLEETSSKTTYDFVGHNDSSMELSHIPLEWLNSYYLSPAKHIQSIQTKFALTSDLLLTHQLQLIPSRGRTMLRSMAEYSVSDKRELYQELLALMGSRLLPKDLDQAIINGQLHQYELPVIRQSLATQSDQGVVQIHFPRHIYDGLSFHIRQECHFKYVKQSSEMLVLPTAVRVHDVRVDEILKACKAQQTTGSIANGFYQIAKQLGVDLHRFGACEDFKNTVASIEQLTYQGGDLHDLYWLPMAKNLKELDLSNNQIDDIEPITALADLVSLKLSHNQIHEIVQLPKLQHLKELDLSQNQIQNFGVFDAWNQFSLFERPVGILSDPNHHILLIIVIEVLMSISL